jgi:ATP-binding cassette subfamily F protein 3
MEKAAYTSDVFTQVRAILGAFLFSGDDVYKKVNVLSGGEKSRLALARMLLSPLNTLILDEPTNHLDIRSKEVLKNALLEFKGTLVVVSHDRDFLKGLTDKTFEFTPEGIKEHLGGIDEFLNRKKAENFRSIENKKEENVRIQQAVLPVETKIKQVDKDLKKLQQSVKNSEKRIADLESEISEYDKKLMNPSEFNKVSSDQAFFTRYEALKKNLEDEILRWEKALEELENASD